MKISDPSDKYLDPETGNLRPYLVGELQRFLESPGWEVVSFFLRQQSKKVEENIHQPRPAEAILAVHPGTWALIDAQERGHLNGLNIALNFPSILIEQAEAALAAQAEKEPTV